MSSFFSLFVSFAFLFSSTSFAIEKKANPINASQKNSDSPLLSSKDLESLSPDEKERYLDALREFFQENQAEPQTFSQYFMDILSGDFLANAASSTHAYDETDCSREIYRSAGDDSNFQIGYSKECFNKFISTIKSGELGECKESKKLEDTSRLLVHCETNQNGKIITRNYTLYEKEATPISRVKAAMSDGNQIAAQNEAERKITSAGASVPKPAAPTSEDLAKQISNENKTTSLKGTQGDAPKPQKGKDSLARCFYAGFVINKAKNANSCVAVQDLCASNERVLPAQAGIQNALGCREKKINSSCVSKDDTKGKIAAGKKNNEVVACNPLLFGLSGSADPKSVICVKKSGNASQNCLKKMELDINAKKNLDALLKNTDGAKAFNELKSEIEKQCKPYWKFKEGTSDPIKDEDARKISVTAPTPRPAQAGTRPAAPADLGEGVDDAVKGRSEKANKDFNRTCKVLLNRVREIKPSGAGSATPSNGRLRSAVPGAAAPGAP